MGANKDMDTIQVVESESHNRTVLVLPAAFTFRLYNEFRGCYESLDQHVEVEIDLSKVTHLDSSALGMLVAVWEHMGRSSEKVVLTNMSEPVRKILENSNFHQLFTMT
ncbi:STAS domain-containing protein [Magnetococcus sp. PR-3]|uniref:STAS domain-containing protein n=1 Tax=Magnetococcus sp. PR-3 TaxID=3120355 RepID=UPI002FCE5BF7